MQETEPLPIELTFLHVWETFIKLACLFCAVALNRIGKLLLLCIFLGQNDSDNFSYFLMDRYRGEQLCLVHTTLIQELDTQMFIVSCGLTSAATAASYFISLCLPVFCEKICPLPTHCTPLLHFIFQVRKYPVFIHS